MLAACALLACVPVRAHEIPRDVVVHAFVKPETGRAVVLLRLPAVALRDIQFPETPDGNLDVARAMTPLRDGVTQWILPSLELRENGVLLPPRIAALRVSMPSDRAFASFETARAHVTGEEAAALIPPGQALVDVMLEAPIASERSAFSIRPGFERLGLNVLTSLRFVTVEGTVRPFELRGDPGIVDLDPRWHQAAWRFVRAGFLHILDGTDHLLFLACLVIPFRRLRPLVIVVTGFTAAHSVALIAAAMGVVPGALWFPPLVETLIAASVLYMALENVLRDTATRSRTALAFGFGLLHGFGFSFALTDTMQFAGSHLAAALFAFNLGVELGQIAVLLVLVPALAFLFRHVRERIGIIVLSLIAAHVSWHWMEERWAAFREFPLPSPGSSELLVAVRILIGLAVVVGGIWVGRAAIRHRRLTFIE